MTNTIPTSPVSPYIIVRDVEQSMRFYQQAFGFRAGEAVTGDDGIVSHGELSYKEQLIMVGKEGAYGGITKAPITSGVESPMSLYVYCDDVDAFYIAAIKAGAISIIAPTDTFWGDRMCKIKDIDGYDWAFATRIAIPCAATI